MKPMTPPDHKRRDDRRRRSGCLLLGGSFNQPARVDRGIFNSGTGTGHQSPRQACGAGDRRRAGVEWCWPWWGMIGVRLVRSSPGQGLLAGRDPGAGISVKITVSGARTLSSRMSSLAAEQQNVLARCCARGRRISVPRTVVISAMTSIRDGHPPGERLTSLSGKPQEDQGSSG